MATTLDVFGHRKVSGLDKVVLAITEFFRDHGVKNSSVWNMHDGVQVHYCAANDAATIRKLRRQFQHMPFVEFIEHDIHSESHFDNPYVPLDDKEAEIDQKEKNT